MKKMGLESCLLCGCIKMEEQENGSLYRIRCPGCKTVTRWFSDKREAKTAWNRREVVSAKKLAPVDEEEVPPVV
jgi:phage FluMu protein Com